MTGSKRSVAVCTDVKGLRRGPLLRHNPKTWDTGSTQDHAWIAGLQASFGCRTDLEVRQPRHEESSHTSANDFSLLVKHERQ